MPPPADEATLRRRLGTFVIRHRDTHSSSPLPKTPSGYCTGSSPPMHRPPLPSPPRKSCSLLFSSLGEFREENREKTSKNSSVLPWLRAAIRAEHFPSRLLGAPSFLRGCASAGNANCLASKARTFPKLSSVTTTCQSYMPIRTYEYRSRSWSV